MKNYETPAIERLALDTADLLSASGELGDAIQAEIFSSEYGKKF